MASASYWTVIALTIAQAFLPCLVFSSSPSSAYLAWALLSVAIVMAALLTYYRRRQAPLAGQLGWYTLVAVVLYVINWATFLDLYVHFDKSAAAFLLPIALVLSLLALIWRHSLLLTLSRSTQKRSSFVGLVVFTIVLILPLAYLESFALPSLGVGF